MENGALSQENFRSPSAKVEIALHKFVINYWWDDNQLSNQRYGNVWLTIFLLSYCTIVSYL